MTGETVMTLYIGVDFHPHQQTVAWPIAFTRKIDETAACMYALQHDVLAAQDIPVQGIGREA